MVDSVEQSSTRARTADLARNAVVRDGIPTEWAAGWSCRIEIFALMTGVARAEKTQAWQRLTKEPNNAAGEELVDGFAMLAGMCSCD